MYVVRSYQGKGKYVRTACQQWINKVPTGRNSHSEHFRQVLSLYSEEDNLNIKS